MHDMKKQTLVKVDNISKKFCRDLKTSLLYGLKDIANEFIPRKNYSKQLREKEFWALKNISLELNQGEVLGLIGKNGSGKTTLLRLINGLIKPDNGIIEVKGRVGALIALGAGFNPILTGRENVYVNGSVLGLSKTEIDSKFDEIVEFSELEDFIDTPVQNYSSGMQVRLGFAVAAQMDPDLLLTDEVLAVGDFRFSNKCFSMLQKLKNNGTSTILVSHSMGNILQFADRVVWLDNGVIKEIGEPRKVCGLFLNSYHDIAIDGNNNNDSSLYGEILINDDLVSNVLIELSNNSEKSVKKIGAFEPVVINYFMNIMRENNIGITFKLHRRDGQIITIFENRLDGVNIKPKNNSIKGSIKINSLNLIPGNYVLVMVVQEGTEFIYRNVVLYFNIDDSGQEHDIYRNNIQSGLIRLKHKWDANN